LKEEVIGRMANGAHGTEGGATIRRIATVALAVILPAQTVCGQTTSKDTVAVRAFVQQFYDGYLTAKKETRGPAWWLLMHRTPSGLSAELIRALRGDSLALVDKQQTRESLNFDPILMSQDPCPRYKVGSLRVRANAFRVGVHSVCPGMDSTNVPPSVIVEVGRNGAHWEILNFFYSSTDLKSLLCGYAKADTRRERRPASCRG